VVTTTSHPVSSSGLHSCAKEVLEEWYELQWYGKMTQSAKLRTYRLFKDYCKPSAYVRTVYNKNYRSALSKFRCGVAPIRLETGRYEHLQIDERICPTCNVEVETEEHVLIRCSSYDEIRRDLFNRAVSYNAEFYSLSHEDQLCFILDNEKMCFVSAKACSQILLSRRKMLYNY
jgi:hypothetical protein